MGDTRDDDGRRHRAIKLHREGVAFGVILERLGRARSRLAKWLRRYREAGWAGLQPRSRAPQRQWHRTPERVVARILAIRETLEQQKTRRARFAGVGAEVVQLDPQGTIDINGKPYAVGRRLAGRYITATIFTHRRMLVVNVGARRHKRFPFPISERLVAPIGPLLRGPI